MRISSAEIAMSGGYSYLREVTTRENLEVWVDNLGRQQADASAAGLQQTIAASQSSPVSTGGMVEDQENLLLKLLIELLTGEKVETLDADELKGSISAAGGSVASAVDTSAGQGTVARAGWGVRYDYSQSLRETQTANFKSSGIIKTADNREIRFSIDVSIIGTSSRETGFSFRAGDASRAVDPLVVNFNGPASTLTDARFSFDLNADGHQENIAFVGPGSGILVLDKNGDGKATDGTELFGPTTGNGFSELAAFDRDGNSWIDEADEVFNRLRIWTKDVEGRDIYSTLGDKNIGALYTGSLDSNFTFLDSSGQASGELRRFGLYAAGAATPSVGTLQQIDLYI